MKMEYLTSICSPKQWKTISSDQLHAKGYPVYGANGKIGFFSEYTHEKETLLITCRGATCGSLNVCEPYSYVNGNAMALDDLSKDVDLYFLKYFLQKRGLNDVISGSAQPQITGQSLKQVQIPLPPLTTQKRIAAILDAADLYRQKTKALVAKYDQLAQSLFLEMFGDPVRNPKEWVIKKLDEISFIDMGQSPDGTSYNLNQVGAPLLNGPTEFGLKYPIEKQWTSEPRKFCKRNDILFCVRGATAGRMNWADKEYCIGRGLAAIRTKGEVSNSYIYMLLERMYDIFQKTSNGSTFINISRDDLRNVNIQLTPIALQTLFATRIQLIEAQKQQALAALQKSEILFNSLLQKAFKGELVAE